MSEEQKPKSLEEIYAVPEYCDNYNINDKFVKSAIHHFLNLNSSFTIFALYDALKKECYYEKIKVHVENMSTKEFTIIFGQFYFEKRTIREQKKEILTFMLNYDYFLSNFPIKFRDECKDYNIMNKTNFSKN